MKSVALNRFIEDAESYLRQIDGSNEVLIVRGPGKKGCAILPIALYNSYKETLHLLSTTANTNRLIKGMRQAER